MSVANDILSPTAPGWLLLARLNRHTEHRREFDATMSRREVWSIVHAEFPKAAIHFIREPIRTRGVR